MVTDAPLKASGCRIRRSRAASCHLEPGGGAAVALSFDGRPVQGGSQPACYFNLPPESRVALFPPHLTKPSGYHQDARATIATLLRCRLLEQSRVLPAARKRLLLLRNAFADKH
jgi:hypothetical protein